MDNILCLCSLGNSLVVHKFQRPIQLKIRCWSNIVATFWWADLLMSTHVSLQQQASAMTSSRPLHNHWNTSAHAASAPWVYMCMLSFISQLSFFILYTMSPVVATYSVLQPSTPPDILLELTHDLKTSLHATIVRFDRDCYPTCY
jgi:hypothetical protein